MIRSDRWHRLVWALPLLVAACGDPAPALLGTLEWDRVALRAEASEPVLRLPVTEGTVVTAGTELLVLDPARAEAALTRARAGHREATARYQELTHGARSEVVEAARANLRSTQAALTDAERELQRMSALRQRDAVSTAAVDRARTARDQANAAAQAATAQLQELTHGTRPEQLEQAAAAVDAAQAAAETLRLNLERLTVRAPRAGRVDALPFKPGDQPPAGSVVASLLVGDAPYARLFVPASQRARIAVGSALMIEVEGLSTPLRGRVRSIRSEPDFTPYYALTGDDASRLSYRAEVQLEPADAIDLPSLPAGLPVRASLDDARP